MDITRVKTVSSEGKVASPVDWEKIGYIGWKLTVKNKGVEATFDFDRFKNRPKLAKMFMTAIDGLSAQLRSEKTLKNNFYCLVNFWHFMSDIEASGKSINEPQEINSQVISQYVTWLKGQTDWTIGTQYCAYMPIKTMLLWLRRHHRKNLNLDLHFPINPFPQKNRQQKHRQAYPVKVAEQIKNAVVTELEEIKRKVETPYVKTGKGIDPRSGQGTWKEFDNVVWYFENVLDCQYQTPRWLKNNGHSMFIQSAFLHHKGLTNVWDTLGVWKTPPAKTGKGVDPRSGQGTWKEFDNVVWYFENVLDCQYRKRGWLVENAHESFVNAAYKNHKGLANVWDTLGVWKTPPAKTGKGVDPRSGRGAWKEFDNVVWYFENVFDCQYRTTRWLMNNGHSSFIMSTKEYHKGLTNVWDTLGVWSGTTLQQLVPFYLLFAYLSGANPTPIGIMRRDCIAMHPTLPKKGLVLQKNRSKNDSYKVQHSALCVSIVERVLDLTRDLAQEAGDDVKDYLWLYKTRGGKIDYVGRTDCLSVSLNDHFKSLVKKYDIRDENGKLVKLNTARLRPTFANRMFTKTKGDMVKIKLLLNHSWMSTTQTYVTDIDKNSIYKDAAKVLAKHEDKLRAQIVVGDVASELGLSREEAVKILSGEYDTYLGKCRNVFESPLEGEKKGISCTKFNSCLKCQNCLITESDLHRLSSYYNQIDCLRKFMPSDLFYKTYGWVIEAINEVYGRFDRNTVEKARLKALADPYPAWDMKLGLAESLENVSENNKSTIGMV